MGERGGWKYLRWHLFVIDDNAMPLHFSLVCEILYIFRSKDRAYVGLDRGFLASEMVPSFLSSAHINQPHMDYASDGALTRAESAIGHAMGWKEIQTFVSLEIYMVVGLSILPAD